jgi:hypothetical protein
MKLLLVLLSESSHSIIRGITVVIIALGLLLLLGNSKIKRDKDKYNL